jgi:hypothetical protein
MKLTGSMATLLIALCALLTMGFVCGSENKTATNTAATNGGTDTKPATSTGSSSPAATATPKSAPKDISGRYSATGKNAGGGGNYEADLIVTNRDEVYQFSWDSKGRKYDGVGVQTDDKVAVSFADGTNGNGCGVTLYKINSDGSLDGVAGYWGRNQKETEKATRTSGSDLEGEYDIRGKNPDGKEYTGKLKITKEGEGYRFEWTGQNAFEGFGVKIGDTVSVGFGGKQCGFVAYEIKSDGTLDGKWGGSGTTDFGTETAKKN